MTTSQKTPGTELPEPQWHEAMAEFRARAQRLFEVQRDRVQCLETVIAEQLATIEQADKGASKLATNDSRAKPDASPEELEHLRTQVAQSRKLLNARASELKQLRSLLAEQADGVEGLNVKAFLEQLSKLRAERDELVGRLADAQRHIQQATVADPEHFQELQRRFEVAVNEIRELKARNADLQQQASRGEGSPRDAAPAATGFDWEQQKRRLMQQLESDLDDGVAKDKAAKLSIESTIRITDQVIAEKDRQIADLKALLQDKAAHHSNEDTSSEVLDNDELIRKERERLSRLKEELQAKLRQAEIDISVERAKLARERSELEAKLRSLEESGGERACGKPAAKQSGRWLNRLGLKDDDK